MAAVPVVSSVPGIFSADSSGKGQGAILNQDQSRNSSSRPAAPGSVIVLFATGEGQTQPIGSDGFVTGTTLPKPMLPVSVTVGGVKAQVIYAGEAPTLVSGVLQVNAIVPPTLSTGNQPVVLTVGSAQSLNGITVAVGR